MKLRIEKNEFNRWWQFAERVTSTKNTISALGGVLCTVSDKGVTLEATDLRTSLRCVPVGVNADGEGQVILPAKLLGELFRKLPADEFTIDIKGEKGTLSAGKNKTRFTTWSVTDYPKLPSPEESSPFCEVQAGELLRTVTEGIVASSQGDSFPSYLASAMFHAENNVLSVISTDMHRLALSKADCVNGPDAEMLLPVASVKELQRLLSNVIADVSVTVMVDSSLSWFRMGNIEFSIRRVESSFPNYMKILNPKKTTTMIADRSALMGAIERIDAVVRDFTRVMVMKLSPGGDLVLSGRSPTTGAGMEAVDANITGEPVTSGFNLSYIQDGLKAFKDTDIQIGFDGSGGQVTLTAPNRDNFLYMTMPVKSFEDDLPDDEDEAAGDSKAEPAVGGEKDDDGNS